ncbi:MAG: hypothetical protein IJZ89_08135 [Clostridia bacterium]|nr:hypothetical protein [Clostridia bacterium]
MSRRKIMLYIVYLLIIAAFFAVNALAIDNFMRSDLYTVTEHENMSDFDLVTLARTSAFGWRLQDGTAPEQKYENGLPAYLLLAESESCIAEFYSLPTSPIDAYNFKEISFVIRVTSGEYDTFRQNCKFILSLRSGNKTLECTGNIAGGTWNVITFDISAWKQRKNITEMTVSLVGADSSIPLRKVELSGPYVKNEKAPSMENFMSEGLYASGTELEIIDKGSPSEALRIYLNAQRISISGVAAVPYTEEDCNAVRIVLANASDLRSLQFNYSHLDPSSGRNISSSKNMAIEPNSGRLSYIISTGEVSFISDFSIILDSASTGMVTIYSIEPVAIYEGYTDNVYGSVSECKTDTAGKNIILSGTVYHNYLISHDDHTLVCYMLRTGETLEEAVAGERKPDASAKMSSRFNFEMKISSLGEFALISKYAVASLSPEGEYTLLMPPVSLSGDFGRAETAQGRTNIKGLESDYISAAIDCGVGTAIIDVYLDKLTSLSHSGHLYTIENTFIYFDADYVSSLDKQIKNLYAAGCKVYLRLLISGNADRSLLPYASKAESSEAEFLAVDISDSEAEKHFYAAVDFLASRYSKISNGKISGMVLGKSIDQWEKYNFSDKNGIIEYARMVAEAFEIMARCAVVSIKDLEVFLPISDARGGISGYDSALLLTSVCRYLEEGGDLEFSLILEGTHVPYSIGEANADEADVLIKANYESGYYCTDNLYVFESMLSGLSKISSGSPKSYIYLWSPDPYLVGNSISAAYIYNYYSIMFSDKASAFVLSLPEGEMGEATIKNLNYLIKYIDTERNSQGTLCLSALEIFGAESWDELIDGYDEELITYRIFHEVDSADELPHTIRGSYALWDFSSAFGTLDWFEGSNCSSVYVDATAKGGKALCAIISDSVDAGKYSDIVYNYEFPDDISLMPYIGFDFYIEDGGSSSLYEVTVILGGNGHRLETVKLIYGGEDSTVIVSTAEHNEMEQIDYIRFCVRTISSDSETADSFKLYLRKVTSYSESENDASLERSINEARAKARNTTLRVDDALSGEPKYEFIIAMAVIIVLSVAMVGFYDRKQK